ncbi:MAG: TraB/GumN family protein [Nanoarchaeota archaeon]
MIHIIGTSHVSRQSIHEITAYIQSKKPDLIAIELDNGRLQALLSNAKPSYSLAAIPKIGIKGYLFAIIGAWVSKKLGQHVGVTPGEDMKTAAILAKREKIPLKCIDQPIQYTLHRFSKTLSWNERWHFIQDIITGIFRPKKLPFDPSRVPSSKIVDKLLGYVKRRYPNIYKTLIEERNIYMTARLKKLQDQYPDKHILVVVGAGHKEGMEQILGKGLSYSYTVTVGS